MPYRVVYDSQKKGWFVETIPSGKRLSKKPFPSKKKAEKQAAAVRIREFGGSKIKAQSLSIQADLYLLQAELELFEAPWLGEGQQVARDASGRFTSKGGGGGSSENGQPQAEVAGAFFRSLMETEGSESPLSRYIYQFQDGKKLKRSLEQTKQNLIEGIEEIANLPSHDLRSDMRRGAEQFYEEHVSGSLKNATNEDVEKMLRSSVKTIGEGISGESAEESSLNDTKDMGEHLGKMAGATQVLQGATPPVATLGALGYAVGSGSQGKGVLNSVVPMLGMVTSAELSRTVTEGVADSLIGGNGLDDEKQRLLDFAARVGIGGSISAFLPRFFGKKGIGFGGTALYSALTFALDPDASRRDQAKETIGEEAEEVAKDWKRMQSFLNLEAQQASNIPESVRQASQELEERTRQQIKTYTKKAKIPRTSNINEAIAYVKTFYAEHPHAEQINEALDRGKEKFQQRMKKAIKAYKRASQG